MLVYIRFYDKGSNELFEIPGTSWDNDSSGALPYKLHDNLGKKSEPQYGISGSKDKMMGVANYAKH